MIECFHNVIKELCHCYTDEIPSHHPPAGYQLCNKQQLEECARPLLFKAKLDLDQGKWLFSVYKVLSFNFTNRVLDKCDCEEPCNKIVYETKAHYTKLAYDDIVAADIYFPTLTYTEFIELPTYQTIDFISEFSHFLQGPADQKQDQEKLRNCCATRSVLSMSQAVRRSLIIEINITG